MAAPACVANTVSVGAVWDSNVGSASVSGCTDATTAANKVTCFTNSNSTLDLMAPGAPITSTRLGGGRSTFYGTSQASPHAAGTAALLLEVNPALTPNQIETTLKTTGVSVTDPKNGLTFPRVNALAAINTLTGTTAKAAITSPTPGSTLSGSAVTFAWSAGSGASQYWLHVGSTVGGRDLYDQSQGTSLSGTVSGLPTDGRTVYVRLWSFISGAWQFNDYTYTAASGGGTAKAAITSPTPGSTLSGSAVTFAWSAGSGASQYWLHVGSTVGGRDLYDQSQGTSLSGTVSGLPTDGRTVYVRLWSFISGAWQFNDYTYTAASGGHPFQGGMTGTWTGTCGGIRGNGTFSINIDTNGNVEGRYFGTLEGSLTGRVTGTGSLTSSGSGSDGVTWWGNMAVAGGGTLSGSGNWVKNDAELCSGSGTWRSD